MKSEYRLVIYPLLNPNFQPMEKNNWISVLIIDNILTSNLTLKNLMVDIYHRVDSVFWCREALDRVEKNNYDFIIMRIGTPWMNWIETTKMLKFQLDKFEESRTDIIWFCSNPDDFKKEYIDSWMSDVIEVPLDIERILIGPLDNLIPKKVA